MEGLLRLYVAIAPHPPGSTFLPDPDMAYRLRPDDPSAFEENPDGFINSLGFRDRPRSRGKPDGVYRILGIGDSFVYGSTKRLDDHFLRIAERHVDASGAILGTSCDSLELLLMGVGGYSPENEVGVLRAVGLSLAPDLVVLNFFVGNDVTGIPVRSRVIAGETYIVGSPYPWLDRLRHSMAFVFTERLLLPPFRETMLSIYSRLARRNSRLRSSEAKTDESPARTGEPAAGSQPAELPAIPVHSYSPWYLHSQLKDLPVYLEVTDRRTESLWEESENYLREFDRLCRDARVPWVLHLIPADVQVDDGLRRDVLSECGLEGSLFDFDAPQRRLRAFAQELSVPCHDPLADMRSTQANGKSLYRVDDIHFSVRGNRVAGESLGRFLADWIPEERRGSR